MTTQIPPKKGTAFTFYVSLVSRSSRPQFQANPTLAAGDVKIAIDDGAPANMATLPAVDADFTRRVKVVCDTAEMNGDVISIILADAAGDEWDDLYVEIQTSAQTLDEIDTNVDAILADTGTDGVALATGAITAGVIATDAIGAAELAADAVAEIWAYSSRTLTQSAASVTAAVSGSDITVYRGTTWSIALTNIGALTVYDKVYFTVKYSPTEADSRAVLQTYNDTDEGLIYFASSTPVSIANGLVTIDDIPTGDITITVQPAETISAPVGTFFYDIKGVDLDGSVVLLSSGGKFTVVADITRVST